jgi:zinc transporter ZupT
MPPATTLPLLLLALPVAATLAGGLFALRLARFRPVLVALGAGLLLGAAFLDLLPEAIALGNDSHLSPADVLGLTLGFFLLFAIFEQALNTMERRAGGVSARQRLGRVAGGMLIFHSFRDGMAIGAAFAASHAAGYAVATGIVAHDFGDGMNTVILTTAGEKATRADYLFLLADALAPFFGGLLTVWWLLSSRNAALLLALAAGFFLQMATSDFLPQLRIQPGADDQKRQWWLMAAVIAGSAVIFAANRLLLPLS